MDDDDKVSAVKFAASIATELLARAEDGTKLLSVTYNYPKGAAAFWYGFRTTIGGIFAFGLVVAISKILDWLASYLMQ
jgi:hypothetical protein